MGHNMFDSKLVKLETKIIHLFLLLKIYSETFQCNPFRRKGCKFKGKTRKKDCAVNWQVERNGRAIKRAGDRFADILHPL